jgi:hypothetical protein
MRRILLALVLVFSGSDLAMSSTPHYVIPSGDGDQNYFSEPIYLTEVHEPWFTGTIQGYGAALLFRVVAGKHVEKYIALTSRTQAGLADHIRKYSWASVVVHVIRDPNRGFHGSMNEVDSIGMATVEIVGHKWGPVPPEDRPPLPKN